jgi:hypothetical protein
MLGAAEPDLEPDFANRTWKQSGKCSRRRRLQINADGRQQCLKQTCLSGPQGPALAASEERAVIFRIVGF